MPFFSFFYSSTVLSPSSCSVIDWPAVLTVGATSCKANAQGCLAKSEQNCIGWCLQYASGTPKQSKRTVGRCNGTLLKLHYSICHSATGITVNCASTITTYSARLCRAYSTSGLPLHNKDLGSFYGEFACFACVCVCSQQVLLPQSKICT